MAECKVDEEELRRLVQDEAMKLPDMSIAISGIAGRFPKSESVNEFEENLLKGLDMINDNDNSRFTCSLWGLPPRAGRLKDLSKFDNEFFGFTVEEANYIDFQLRILYEVVYESIMDAGVNPASLRGTNTGVFFGLHCNEFENAMADDPAFKSNGYYAQFGVKVAQYFDFRGLNITFDAACASGFVALHNGVQAIKAGLIDQAIVCSCNIPIHPTGSFIFLQMQMLSPTGYSRFLDSRADGYVKSEACVSMLLQRKDFALRNYASFMATMTSVDGFKAEGITFPSAKSQEVLIEQTKLLAGISTNHVEYLEAHGTGTPAGDPQEACAISSVYFPKKSVNYLQDDPELDCEIEERKIGPLLVGSVKTNMGHSEAASGLCALTKVILMLENEIIYRGLHFAQPNANIEALMEGKLKFVDNTQDLRAKIVPLSCYGFGGSNVHAIVRANHRAAIECYELDGNPDEDPRLIVMFGRTQSAIDYFFDKLLNFESRNTRNCLADDYLALLDTLSSDKIDRFMNYRGYLVVDRRAKGEKELSRAIRKCELQSVDHKQFDDLGRRKHLQDCKPRECNLILPGLGSQWPSMANGLRGYEPFWSTIERLADILEPLELDLITILSDSDVLGSMASIFVGIVAYQIALINIVRDQLKVNGLKSIIGHSLGEITCAYASRLFDERETILVAYYMGKTLDENKHLIEGKMVALGLNESEVSQRIAGYNTIQVSCVNGPQSVTISGANEEIDSFCTSLSGQNVFMKDIGSEIALHNEKIMNEDVRDLLEEALLRVLLPGTEYKREGTAWISSACGVRDSSQANARYFADSLCKKLDFFKSWQQLADDSIICELGPSGLFESLMKQSKSGFHYVKMMKRSTPANEQQLKLIESLGELYLNGATFNNLTGFHGKSQEFPVKRQTPSISSLVQWKHEQSLFVPRYPVQFSKSSAKCEMPIDIIQDRDKYITGHCIEGRILFPATGYLFLIWRVFSFTRRKIFDACFHDVEDELVPIEFRDVKLMRAILLGNRLTQVYIHYEEGTGRWEIKEGGSVVAEGFAMSPVESPDGLLYNQVRDEIRGENLELTLNADDVYKQFRVSGYDYGETFRNIESASSDGRYCKVKYNGHFVAFTDSILQSIFLAITQYAPSGGLFLPTRFDYVRFQPKIILNKIREAKMVFDVAGLSSNRQRKREIMTKIMQRESGDLNATSEPEENNGENEEVEQVKCIFETFCDPITGIIISDGIEMRGIKATPAPRRADNNEVLLESYQFVRDVEDPICDEPLTKFEKVNRKYAHYCDSMSIHLLGRLFTREALKELLESSSDVLSKKEISSYLNEHLNSLYQPESEDYDVKKNGDRMLMSVLDQLSFVNNPKEIKQVVEANRVHLMHDLIQSSFTSERFMRPLFELVIENSCVKKMKLKMMEINVDDGLMKDPLLNLIQRVEPTLSLDYSLAHPDLDRLIANKLLSNASSTKTFTLRDLQSLFSDRQLRDLDVIVYKDISCYSLPKQVIEQNGLAPVLSSLNGAVRLGGFVMMLMRHKLTLSERILLSLSEPELVGLSKKSFMSKLSSLSQSLEERNAEAVRKINQINEILAARCNLMLKEAERNEMICLAKKSDDNGCMVLLFKTTNKRDAFNEDEIKAYADQQQSKRVLVRVRHDNTHWLEDLKLQFKAKEDTQEDQQVSQVWLCAIASRQNPISGLIGMMQALKKELGSLRLRCFFDTHTFKDRDEPVSLLDIENCEKFQLAVRRNLLWTCVDSRGCVGSYRHFTINTCLNEEESLCKNTQQLIERKEDPRKPINAAFANNSVRGDLSSFTWFELPIKYLSEKERENLVRVAYSALNFRDIMLATGRLPLDAIPIRQALDDCILGLEYSGYDVQGRRVIGMTCGRGIATHVLNSNSISLEIPDWMSMKEAATIPIVYLTAIMALVLRGRMKRGESVLIHAGSGGVGQAAIRLALHYGLEVFTTVGSSVKRQFLIEEFSLEEDRIFSSRDCEFEERIMRATGGRGVDLVLNSLADDKLQASLRCLADGGRFLEIGKYDLSINAKLELLKLDTNKSFHGVLLDKLFDVDDMTVAFTEQRDALVEILKDGLEKGYVKPIKYTVFKKNQIEEAFRFMATGKHIGKVLIEMSGEDLATSQTASNVKCISRFQLSGEKSYIVTGGLGGFGLELVKWLVNQGARHLLLTSRTGIKTGYQRATLERLESSNKVKFVVVDNSEADTTTYDGAEKLLQMAREFAPSKQVGGLFHLAMILRDTLLENMTVEDFELVCKPKVDTCMHLDAISRKLMLNLDYFVAFSSVTSGKGNAGQANYAYANSCLERICEQRRADNLHALAIQWGAIGDVGVAFENLGGNDVVIGGTIPQRLPSCWQSLSKLLASPFATCLSVLPVNRSSEGQNEKGDLVGAIMHVLGIKDPSKVSESATLGELGLDSLMAVEIRQYIEREYDMTLNIQEIRLLTIGKIREIGENEGAIKQMAPTQEKQEVREVQSYGTVNEVKSEDTTTEKIQKSFGKSQNEAIQALFDKNTVASYVPQLELPKADFRRLNYKQSTDLDSNCALLINGSKQSLRENSTRPIFFVPPIHGDFKRLELVCSNIKRPCIGLEWTRKLGRVQTVNEAVEVYLELLKRADWSREFYLTSEHADREERVVNLVGYSYGATIAFELMLAIHKLQRRAARRLTDGLEDNLTDGIRAGRLILLDGSPKQIELGSQYISDLTRRKPLQLAQKVDEMLMVYILAHTRNNKQVDYVELQRTLSKTQIESKIKFASERLAELLGISKRNKRKTNTDDERITQIGYAMEAFCRRYELISTYKANWSLPDDCTLIRAEKVSIMNKEEKSAKEDLDLQSVVKGKVHLFIMSGDHETFLDENHVIIGSIIEKQCK